MERTRRTTVQSLLDRGLVVVSLHALFSLPSSVLPHVFALLPSALLGPLSLVSAKNKIHVGREIPHGFYSLWDDLIRYPGK